MESIYYMVLRLFYKKQVQKEILILCPLHITINFFFLTSVKLVKTFLHYFKFSLLVIRQTQLKNHFNRDDLLHMTMLINARNVTAEILRLKSKTCKSYFLLFLIKNPSKVKMLFNTYESFLSGRRNYIHPIMFLDTFHLY